MRREFVTVKRAILAFVALLFAVCFSLGLYAATRAAIADEADVRTPAVTYVIGDDNVTDESGFTYDEATNTYVYASHETGWMAAYNAAVGLQIESQENALVEIKLASDWIAKANEEGTNTAFGTGNIGFRSGQLYLSNGIEVRLDLNDKVIDRNLSRSETAVYNGGVLYVDNAELELVDSAERKTSHTFLFEENEVSVEGGMLTGGFNSNVGGGVFLNADASLTLTSGSIAFNQVQLEGAGSAPSGAGVYVLGGAELIMNGGAISYNVAKSAEGMSNLVGGGVMAGGRFVMNGGKISYNRILTDNAATGLGAAIGVIGSGTELLGGAIEYNAVIASASGVGKAYGGAIFSNTSLVIGNGENGDSSALTIEHNEVVGTKEARGGAIQQDGGTVTIREGVAFRYNHTWMLYNGGKALSTIAVGGVFFLNSGTFTVEGGEFEYNTAGIGGIGNTGTSSGVALNLKGGRFQNNLGAYVGGIFTAATIRLNISGAPVITNNYQYSTETTPAKAVSGYVYSNGDDAVPDYLSGFNGSITVYQSNLYKNAGNITSYPWTIGTLKEGAKISYYTEKAGDGIIAADYAKNNGAKKTFSNGTTEYTYSVIADPNDYFVPDATDAYLAVNEEGQLVELKEAPVFKTAYGAESADLEEVAGYVKSYTFLNGNALTAQIDGSAEVGVTKNGEAFEGDIVDAGVYRISRKLTSKTNKSTFDIAFTVVIEAKDLTEEEVSVTIDRTSFDFDGDEKKPNVTAVAYGALSITDYKVSYEDNRAVGEANAVVTFHGNYVGTAKKAFTITKSEGAFDRIVWQWNTSENAEDWTADSSSWSDITAETKLTYAVDGDLNAIDQSARIRAKLEKSAYTEYVYAEKNEYNRQTLSFKVGTEAAAFKGADTYEVSVTGDSNYTMPTENVTKSLTIAPMALNLKADDLTDTGNLWGLSVGTGDRTNFLLDGENLTYVVRENGELVLKQGEKGTSYARYRGIALALNYNADYAVGGGTLGNMLAYAPEGAITLTSENKTNAAAGTVGTKEACDEILTTLTVDFGDNFTLSDGTTKLTLTKTWYIITVNNALRDVVTKETATAPAPFTYGVALKDELLSPRPEHGDAVIWSVLSGETVVKRFAVSFDGNGVQTLYGATEENGVYAVDFSKPLGEGATFGDCLEGLNAGNYVLGAYVPEYEVGAGIHFHWWEENPTEETIDSELTFYAFTENFNFVVNPYDIGYDREGLVAAEVKGSHTFTGFPVEPKEDVIITFDGEKLTLNTDFECVSFNNCVEVTTETKKAWTVIRGNGNFTGNLTVRYEIYQATNTWATVPSIVTWAYKRFDERVNRIYGLPTFGSNETVTFKIASDAEGTPVNQTLASFKLTQNGSVPTTVARALNDLKRGAYYLFAHAASDENGNYTELKPAGIRFEIFAQANDWVSRASIGSWVWDSYSADSITVNASALAGTVEFAFSTYVNEEAIRQPFGENNDPWFTLTEGKLPAEINDWLASRPVGKYRLEARVLGDEFGSYAALSDALDFEVYSLQNAWVTDPSIGSWNWNEFNKDTLTVTGTAIKGDVFFEIYYMKDNAIEKLTFGEGTKFTSLDETVLNVLKDLNAGEYHLVATVEAVPPYNYNGLSSDIVFTVNEATNEWVKTPEVIAWTFGAYNKNTNLVLGSSLLGTVYFTVSDANGTEVIPAFTVDENGLVSESVEKAFAKLVRGSYTLNASVAGNGSNYKEMKNSAEFAVGQAVNGWSVTPSVQTWTEGKYNKEEFPIVYEALFGNGGAHVVVTVAGDEEKVIYDNLNDINLLETAEHGLYTLTVSVEGTNDYTSAGHTLNFRIFEKPGLPWWAILLIVVGSLGVAALVLFILHEKGVLQMLTGKVVLAMRTRATIDATIAAVRANKVAERAKMTVAAARAREGLEAARAAKKMTAEERAAALEERSKAAAEKSEKLRLKAEKMERRANRIKKKNANAAEEGVDEELETQETLESVAEETPVTEAESPVTAVDSPAEIPEETPADAPAEAQDGAPAPEAEGAPQDDAGTDDGSTEENE